MKKTLLIISGILLIVMQYRLFFGDGNIPEVMALSRTLEQEKKITLSMHDRNTILAAEIHDLKDKVDAVEERARKDLGMVLHGEKFYLFADTEIVNENSSEQ